METITEAFEALSVVAMNFSNAVAQYMKIVADACSTGVLSKYIKVTESIPKRWLWLAKHGKNQRIRTKNCRRIQGYVAKNLGGIQYGNTTNSD